MSEPENNAPEAPVLEPTLVRRGRPANKPQPPAKEKRKSHDYQGDLKTLQANVDVVKELLSEALIVPEGADENPAGWALVRVALKRLNG